MRSLRTLVLFVLFLCASSAIAQTLTIGNPFVAKPGSYAEASGGRTFVDLSHPATANGTIVKAAFALGTFESSCADVATIRFFRRQGNVLTMTAERGPFTWVSDTELFAISPPVQVRAGDLIGIAAEPIKDHWCGNLVVMSGAGEYLAFPDDVTGTVQAATATKYTGLLAVTAAGEVADDYTASIIPVVGSTSGAFGSQWRTSLQLLNPHSAEVAGRLVFRTARVPASAGDPSIPYSLAAGATLTIPDVMTALGRSGLGSLDVTRQFSTGSVAPIVVAHILNDQGNGSAVGLTVEAIDPNDLSQQCPSPAGTMIASHVLQTGATGYLLAPKDPTESRLNIGVRSLGAGATVTATLQAATGEAGQTVTKNYPPDTFEQLAAEEFLGRPLSGGESIAITVTKGSVIVYGTTTNNVSNDPAMQFVHPISREQ